MNAYHLKEYRKFRGARITVRGLQSCGTWACKKEVMVSWKTLKWRRSNCSHS